MKALDRCGNHLLDAREEVHMKNIIRAAIGIAAAATLVACGGGDDGGGGGGEGTTLSMTDNAFSPTDVTVSSGGTVELSNDGGALHNLTIEGTDIDQDVDPGQSASITVDAEAGEYTMFCEYHRDAGMEGTVTVQ
jgi:plastocyanin